MLRASLAEFTASRTASHKSALSEPIRNSIDHALRKKPLRLVVIEDTPMILDIYYERLQRLKGIELVKVPPVESFETAIDIFRHEQPDILVTDLSLTSAHTEGFEILRTLKRLTPSPCVVLTTSIYSPKNHDELNEHIRHARFDAVFHKCDLDHLVAYLESKVGILH